LKSRKTQYHLYRYEKDFECCVTPHEYGGELRSPRQPSYYLDQDDPRAQHPFRGRVGKFDKDKTGEAALALTILLNFTEDPGVAVPAAEKFRQKLFAEFTGQQFILDGAQIATWLEMEG
jgi:hypothetical protein